MRRDAADAKAVIEEYVNACVASSVDRLKALFHENAVMSGYLMGDYLSGSPQPFFDSVEHPPPGIPEDIEYKGEGTRVEATGPIASVTLKKAGFMGMNFTDYFHLT